MALVTLVATIDAYYGPLKPPYLPVAIALIFFFPLFFRPATPPTTRRHTYVLSHKIQDNSRLQGTKVFSSCLLLLPVNHIKPTVRAVDGSVNALAIVVKERELLSSWGAHPFFFQILGYSMNRFDYIWTIIGSCVFLVKSFRLCGRK